MTRALLWSLTGSALIAGGMTAIFYLAHPIEFPLKIDRTGTQTLTVLGYRITTKFEITDSSNPTNQTGPDETPMGRSNPPSIGTRLVCMVTP